MFSSKLTIHVSPSPSDNFRQYAIIDCLAFSDGNWIRWCAAAPSDIVTDTIDEIPALRLYKITQYYKHIELNPRTVVVCAILETQVVGFAEWIMPARFASRESLTNFVYRKGIEYKDVIEDWLFPSWWENPTRVEKATEAKKICVEDLGPDMIDESWELKTLAVLPRFQKSGVGGELVEWGLRQARTRGTKAYVVSSPLGKALYLKKGFKVLGELSLRDGKDHFLNALMLWDVHGIERFE